MIYARGDNVAKDRADQFDLIVLGSGPAGEKGAAQAAYFGKRVALIEKETALGGAAANTGTLPSKTLRETAVFLSGFRHRQLDGLDFRGVKERVSIRDFMTRESLVVERERQRIAANLDRHHVARFQGTASFADPHTIEVCEAGKRQVLQGDVILIATGSYPFRPPGFEFSDPRVFDSDTILRMNDIPESMLVVGGGVIGCEYACMFAILGVRVFLVEKRPRILGFLDEDLSQALQAQMAELGVRFYLKDVEKKVDYQGPAIAVELESGTRLEIAKVLISSGRCGNVGDLKLESIGIQTDKRGNIQVNQHYQTSVPHIYAAGDVVGNPALASTSAEQARVAMAHAFKLEFLPGMAKEAVAPILPYGIFTIPECSMAGATEIELRDKGIRYVVGKASYAGNARGQIVGDADGFLKLLFAVDDMRLLGVHVIGEQATEIVHIGLTALLTNAKADLFIRTCYNYPTLSELYKYATYDALGQRDKVVGQLSSLTATSIQPHD